MGKDTANTELTVHQLREGIGMVLVAMGSLLPREVSQALADRIRDLSKMTMDAGDTNVARLGADFADALVSAQPPRTTPERH